MNTQKDAIPSISRGQKIELIDDLELLDMMIFDSNNQPPLYRPGSYWARKAKSTLKEIKKYGIAEFRGSSNLVGLSYTDNLYIDIRNTYNLGLRRLFQWITNTYPLNKIFGGQVAWTKAYADESIIFAQEILNLKEITKNLLDKYTIPYSLLGNCLNKAKIDGHDYSIHYINRLEQHANLASRIKFNEAYSIFEIGGGFGFNVHILLENYKNIRKVLYLDIPPNLYVGTQYLKAFHGTAVSDYRDLKNLDSIKFSVDDSLEIFCIAPWQIEVFDSSVDIFMNSHSFVEMPNNVVKNYADKITGFHESENTAIALVTYDRYNLNTTLHPNELSKCFDGRKFDYYEVDRLLDSTRKNLYFVSPGKFSFQ